MKRILGVRKIIKSLFHFTGGIVALFIWLKWIIKGKPTVQYPGFHCGCCGKYTKKAFSIPEYQSKDGWWNTWGLCSNCGKCTLDDPYVNVDMTPDASGKTTGDVNDR